MQESKRVNQAFISFLSNEWNTASEIRTKGNDILLFFFLNMVEN